MSGSGMKKWMVVGGLITMLLMITAFPAVCQMAIDPKGCLGCHEDSINQGAFAVSVHGQNGCTSCHVEVTDLNRHLEGELPLNEVQCISCHSQQGQAFDGSIHADNGLSCTACHTEIHAQQGGAATKAAIVATCAQCHDTEAYSESVHGVAVEGGNEDAASCSDCHGLHSIASIGEKGSSVRHAFLTESCTGCHGNEEMMERNEVFAEAVPTYLESYHGKSYRLGSPEDAAGCADCHGAHNVFSKSDAKSTINDANRVETCGQCHEKSSVLFSKFYAHGDHADRANYPILYWTFLGMTGLLVGTFAVFWIHTLLWMFRGFVENRQKIAALSRQSNQVKAVVAGAGDAGVAALDPSIIKGSSQGLDDVHMASHVADAHKLYRRFQKRHIILHLTVIISFLGLSLTGLPLKFADQAWAKTMMSFYGGVHYAGLIHRGCAILTFYYFVGALIMSFDFLFIRKDVKGIWLQRLFGPDSLMPNFKDIRDVTAMVKWFFFRGPKPTFDRWTYWEKFDFLAVFWGMFAIGGSGLMLWFPEFFGLILPGWTFNIATIIHSDEALLATGFIFTVHFFNTHGRPEKFPMDFVIFNGQMTKEEFIEERGDQWKRFEEEGVTEQYAVEKPSGVLYDFILKGFGFVAVFTGLALALLMITAFISG